MDQYILTVVTFFPLVGVFLLSLLSENQRLGIKTIAFVTALLNFIFSLYLYFNFAEGTSAMQFEVSLPWISSLGISYHLGIDGISLFLVILTTLLTAIAILSSFTAVTERLKGFMISMLVLETGMIGVFVSLDLFIFYVFWEVMLIPMYFLIGIWGGVKRIYAAIKFVLFTMFGSLLMLVAIVALLIINYKTTGVYTFDLTAYYDLNLPLDVQSWLFIAFGLAFIIKVPMFPFHTWLPDAHVQAPTAGSVILAGVLLKMGTYGFLRYCIPMFPNAFESFFPLLAILALIGIIYGALVAMVQKDVKSLVAFSSVAHMGFVMLGMFALNLQGLQGSLLQMLNHGISTGALFLIVGMIYERRHTRLIKDFGGIFTVMPVFATFFMIVMLSSIGLPGTNGFAGEFLILLGAFDVNVTYAVIAASGVIFAACYMLWMYQRVMFGKCDKPENQKLTDINWRERLVLIPLVILIFWIGLYPAAFLNKMEPSVDNLIQQATVKRELISKLEAADQWRLADRTTDTWEASND
jgi:NADH-quinone oxidoreductase subunit M